MTAPLRVLHVVEASFEGVGQHVIDLCTWQAGQGWTVDVAWCPDRSTPRFRGDLDTAGCRRTYRLADGSSSPRSLLLTLRDLHRLVKKNGPYDIVHGHSSWAGAWVRLLPGPHRTAYTPNALVTMSDKFSSRSSAVFGRIEQMLARRTDLLIYVSDTEQRHGHALRLRPHEEAVVPNGIQLVPTPTQTQARETLGLDAGRTVVGFVGRLDHQKGVDVLLDAFEEAFADDPEVDLVLIGDGPLRDDLERQSADSLTAQRTRFLGRQPGQVSMPAFDVMAVPSRYEGFPYVVIEGLWAGRVLVVSDQASADALIDNGETGILVSPSKKDLAVALRTAVDLTPEDRARIAGNAHRRASQFSVQAMAEQTAAAYRLILD